MPSTTTRARERGSAVVATLLLLTAVAGLVSTLVGLAPAMGSWSFAEAGAATASASFLEPTVTRAGGSHDVQNGTPTSITIDRSSGAGGSAVDVRGEGFGAGEVVVLRFDSDLVARTTADEHGRLEVVRFRVPTDFGAFAPASFTVSATAAETHRTAEALFTLTG